jgi:hypothetical protein
MSDLSGNKKSELPTRIVPYLAPWIDSDRNTATVGAAVGLAAGGVVAGMIAWLGYPQLGGLIGAVLVILLVRMAHHQ